MERARERERQGGRSTALQHPIGFSPVGCIIRPGPKQAAQKDEPALCRHSMRDNLLLGLSLLVHYFPYDSPAVSSSSPLRLCTTSSAEIYRERDGSSSGLRCQAVQLRDDRRSKWPSNHSIRGPKWIDFHVRRRICVLYIS